MKKVKKVKDDSERWMLSYLDFITLLMIFFLIMYSISNVDKDKYKNLASSLKEGFNVTSGNDVMSIGFNNDEGSNLASTETTEKSKLEEIKQQLDNLITNSNLNYQVSTSIEERGLVLSFNDSILFNSGQADVRSEWKENLVSIAKILNEIDNYIRVEGNTDNVAIQNDKFHSNWQLSSMRSANVVEFLVDECGISPNRLSSVGYSEYRPIKDNSTQEGKAANRRVDILILDSKYNNSETKDKT